MVDDVFRDRRAEQRHPVGKPLGDAAAVKGKICDAGTLHKLIVIPCADQAFESCYAGWTTTAVE